MKQVEFRQSGLNENTKEKKIKEKRKIESHRKELRG